MLARVNGAAAELLTRSRYLNLGTYRRSGTVVDTPLWFAARGNVLVAFTQRGSGKVKRLRTSPRARVAACGLCSAASASARDCGACGNAGKTAAYLNAIETLRGQGQGGATERLLADRKADAARDA